MSQQPNRRDEVAAALFDRKGVILSVFFFSCLTNVLMLTGPVYMLQIYDRVLTSHSVPTLVAITGIVLALYLYIGVLETIRSRVMTRLARGVDEKLRTRVFDATAELALRRVSGTGGQPVNDLLNIRQFLSGGGPLAYFDMPWVPIYLGVTYLLHPLLGLAGLIAAILIFTLAVLTERGTRAPLAEASAASISATLITENVRRNAEALHALGMRPGLRSKWNATLQNALDAQTRASDTAGRLGAASRLTRLMVQSGMLGLGAYLAIKGEITAGTIIAASIIMSRGLAPIEQAVGNWQQFQNFRKSRERLSQVLSAVPVEQARMPLPTPKGLLEVESLTMVAQGQQKPILSKVSFTLRPGMALGVIGPTGAGKSTLARLLVGIQLPSAGTVRLDGVAMDQRSIDDRGRHIGYLPQDVQMFDGTVAENISRFMPGADPKDIVAAAEQAKVHDLITRLPKGYDTMLGENGMQLSVGQKQRLALARVLYGNPVLIVMDEPNSALDMEGEIAVDAAIRSCLQRGAAVVVVAHRPSAINSVTELMVLQDGQPAAHGPRDDILRKVMPGAAAAAARSTAAQPSALTIAAK